MINKILTNSVSCLISSVRFGPGLNLISLVGPVLSSNNQTVQSSTKHILKHIYTQRL